MLGSLAILLLTWLLYGSCLMMPLCVLCQGIGDSGQGAVNAILFVIFTRSVRRRILAICCCFCQRKQQSTKNALQNGQDEVSDDSDTEQFEGSSPMLINRIPQIPKQQHHMGSMATTTSITNSDPSLSSYGAVNWLHNIQSWSLYTLSIFCTFILLHIVTNNV